MENVNIHKRRQKGRSVINNNIVKRGGVTTSFWFCRASTSILLWEGSTLDAENYGFSESIITRALEKKTEIRMMIKHTAPKGISNPHFIFSSKME